jgi:SAM-dependent methyltransferase
MQPQTAELDAHRAAYSEAFPHYWENAIVHAAYGRRIAADIAARGATSALSLGVGHSEVARPIMALLASGPLRRYVVIDGSPEMLSAFRASIQPAPSGLELVEAYFETFDTDERFDVIEAGFVLEHIADPELLLRRLHNLIEDSGRLHVAVPNARSLHRLLGHHAGMLPDMYLLSAADHALGHRRYFDVHSLSTLATRCGWRIERVQGLLLKPFTTQQMHRLGLPPAVWEALQAVAAPYPEIANAFCMELVADQ